MQAPLQEVDVSLTEHSRPALLLPRELLDDEARDRRLVAAQELRNLPRLLLAFGVPLLRQPLLLR